MLQIIGYVILVLLSIFILLIMIYVSAGIQMKSWLDVLDKYIGDKLNK